MKKVLSLSLFIFTLLALLTGCAQEVTGQEEPVIGIIDQEDIPVLTQDSGPVQGGRLNLFMTRPDSLNPLYTTNPYIRQMSQFIFDPLFRLSSEFKAVSFLVESYKTYEDPLILDFKLIDGILFHDGQTLTASDVAFTINTIKKVKERSPYYSSIINIDSIKVIDRLNFRLVLIKQDPNVFEKLVFPILPEHVFEDWPIEGNNENQKLIGTGAFRFDAYQENTIALSRNNDWWYTKISEGLNHPVWMDGIDFRVYESDDDMMQAFQKQQIDIAVIDAGNLDTYTKRADILFNRFKGNRMEYILLSTLGAENSRVANPAIRTILLKYIGWYMALNPLGIGEPASEELETYGTSGNRLSAEDAIKALNELGMNYDAEKKTLYYYKNGNKIPYTLRLKYNGLDIERQKTADWIQKAFVDIGIEVILEKVSEQEEKSVVDSKKFDMMLLGCRIPLAYNVDETLELITRSLSYSETEAVILPLYRKNQAVLYNSKIRGPRDPNWKNIYEGWMGWYLVQSPAASPDK